MSKLGRNKEWCKRYKANETMAKNRKRMHITLASKLEKKRSRMQDRDMDVSGITKAIQHHESLSK